MDYSSPSLHCDCEAGERARLTAMEWIGDANAMVEGKEDIDRRGGGSGSAWRIVGHSWDV